MRSFLTLLICLCLLQKSVSQQNVLLIIADDVGPDYFSCYNSGGGTANTPNINTLAQNGIKFTNVWASPLCSPTRAGIFTGRYPFRTGIGSVITGTASTQLDTSEMSVAKLLRDHAPVKYQTACVGKWHLHANTALQRKYPNKMGFNFYSGNFNGAISNYYSYPMVINGATATAANYATTQTINDAKDWIDSISTQKPFFLWVAFNAPHSPYHVPPATLCNTTGLTGTTVHINASPELYFKAMLESMDTEIGRLLQHLNSKNLLDSTNIIFIGDNGNSQEVAMTSYTNHAKGTLYNYGVNVPMIISGPAVASAPATCTALVNTPDLFATIPELCRFVNWKSSIPQTTKIDGRSMLSLLKNPSSTIRPWMFTEQFTNPSASTDGKTIRDESYHLMRLNNGSEWLFNLSTDKDEIANLLNGTMTATDWSHYFKLCDTLASLGGSLNCIAAGLDESSETSVGIFPCPVKNDLHLEGIDETAEITISNLQGRILIRSTAEENIDVSFLQKGIYLLRIKHASQKITNHKIIVE